MTWASGSEIRRALLLVVALACAGCGPQKPPPAKPIGEAYVVPESLNLRKEIASASGIVGTVKRGERVEIMARRRRFVKVRNAAGVEGWTEEGQLLSPEVYRDIEQKSRASASLPRLGRFRARDALNVHIEPYRWSPSFYRLKAEEKVDLLGRKVAERTSGPPRTSSEPQPASEKPLGYDEWCWIRTAEGRTGWVLSRMIDADIPDEVAQYAEGRRITSYFALDEVTDGDQVKKIWLWTTVERGLQLYDFDSIRIFTWGRRRHRYETAYRERRLRGFFPVIVVPEVKSRYGSGPGFSFVVEKEDGQRYTRRYVLVSPLVRLDAEEPVPAPAAGAPAPSPPESTDKQPEPSFFHRLWQKIRRR